MLLSKHDSDLFAVFNGAADGWMLEPEAAPGLRAVYDAGRADAEQWERRLRAVLSRDPGGEIAHRFGVAGAETDDEVIAAIDAAIEREA